MSIKYKLYEIHDRINPVPKQGLKARAVSSGTINLERIAEFMADASTLTKGDIYGVLINMREMVKMYLGQGYTVKIDDLGSFSVTVESPLVQNEKEIRANSIKFKRVVFKTAKKLNDELSSVRFVKAKK